MPNTITAPVCLHIPELYETLPAEIIWNSTGCDGYDLDRVFDQSFEEAPTHGLTWRNISFEYKSWSEFHQKNLSWLGIAVLPASYVIYRGPGLPIEWSEELGSHRLTWFEWRDKDYMWINIAGLNKTWAELMNLSLDETEHLFHETLVPLGKRFAYFRIRSYMETETGSPEYSEYIYSPRIPISAYLQKRSSVTLQTEPDELRDVQVSYAEVKDEFANSEMTLAYNPVEVQFVEAFILEPQAISTGRDRETQFIVEAQEPGNIVFACSREDPQDYRSGFVVLFRFKGLVSGETQINIS